MFNRTLQVKMVKVDKNETPTQPPARDFDSKFALVNNAVRSLATEVAKGIATYVVLDTVRQVMIERARKG